MQSERAEMLLEYFSRYTATVTCNRLTEKERHKNAVSTILIPESR